MPPSQPQILNPDEDGIAYAADLLKDGAMVAIPTETVYGLAADATNAEAVAEIYKAKGRPSVNPLIVHVADLAAAEHLAFFGPEARDLAGAFWPGPLTLVLPKVVAAGVVPEVSAGLSTLAVRIPAHPVAHAILRAVGRPIAAPSANLSGQVSPTTAAHVAAGLGRKVAAILDAGPTDVGVESTILTVDDGRVSVLRDGGIPREAIAAMTGPLASDTMPAKVTAPGQMTSHYAPNAQLDINSPLQDTDAVQIGFGAGPEVDFSLSRDGNLVEAAARLFAVLHAADALARETGRARISVAKIPEKGLGRAINDRLRRAAAPRPDPL
ncbi:MAG: L-threonylcarbamoyladenylate synthase [Pseudomonadota bacterium]